VNGCLTCDVLSGKVTPPGGTIYENAHFIPRPREMTPGMHPVFLNLDLRSALYRLGIRRWVCGDEEVAHLADRLREEFGRLMV